MIDISKLYTVFFFNFGFTKHFDSKEDALEYAKGSGFECAVIDPRGDTVRKFGAY